MLEKFFNKSNPDSKVQKDKDTKDAVSSMRIIAKNTLLFSSIAKELRSLNSAFSRFVKLHKIEPATGSQISDITKSLSESKEIKVATIKVKKYGTQKKRTFLAGILDFFVTVLKGLFIATLLSVGYVVYKITEIISPYVEKITNIISEAFSFIADGISTVFKDIDWLDLFQTAFKKYLNFISFGLISERQVDSALGQVGSVYKEIIKGIGGFIKSAVNWLAPKLQSIGRYAAKDILGVDVDKLIERRSENERLVKRSQQLKKQYDDLDKQDKELTDKKGKLSEEQSKLLKAEEKKKEADKKKKVAKAAEKEKKKPVLAKEEPKKEEAPTPAAKKEAETPKKEAAPTSAPKKEAAPTSVEEDKKVPTPPPEKVETAPSLSSMVKVMPGVDITSLAPDFANRLSLMAKDFYEKTKIKLQINSGYRSPEKQKELYDEYIARGGKENKNLAPVARPGTSYHEKKLAVDIQATSRPKGEGSTKGFLNELAGYVDEPTGWLEKFGLSRPVTSAKVGAKRKEDWHIQIASSAPTPDAPAGSSTAADNRGNPVDVSTGKEDVGSDLAKKSSDVSKEQRKQSKSKNPTYVNSHTTNNNVLEKVAA